MGRSPLLRAWELDLRTMMLLSRLIEITARLWKEVTPPIEFSPRWSRSEPVLPEVREALCTTIMLKTAFTVEMVLLELRCQLEQVSLLLLSIRTSQTSP